MTHSTLRLITTLCCMVVVVVLFLLYRQVRASVRELRALRAHMTISEALGTADPPDGGPQPAVDADGRHGIHAVDDDPEQPAQPALRTAVAPAWRPARVETVLAFMSAAA